jgi:hypothetical protein
MSEENTQKPESKIVKATFNDVTEQQPKKVAFERTFEFNYPSPEDGKVYKGTFTHRRLNLGLSGKWGVIHARLNNGLVVDMNTDFLHMMISYLDVALVVAPDWWAPAEFYDVQIVRQIYDYARAWEDSFRSGRVA